MGYSDGLIANGTLTCATPRESEQLDPAKDVRRNDAHHAREVHQNVHDQMPYHAL